ncbi:dehydrodolichyl diphosphate synthase complex subunit DHDDS [Diaphorina citri]|uniref:Alkyl transferase n=1 Tax=Diaphorina citri TaxID=121845 RepID=A0A1S3DAL1_DIACI|nr:dehydrodolichyl diphosphate synthase complex subunit DHDDS [Diaphorina citri]
MSWVVDSTLNWFQYAIIKLLKKGHVPKHIAFIMDGNRRYAKRSNAKTIEGHSKGFDKLAETLQWCLDLGVREVTVYAFSIENFKRTEEEVNGLMDLARAKFKRLIEEKDKLNEKGIRIRIIGNIELLPSDLIASFKEAMHITKDNTEGFLNVAFSYTSRDEMVETSRILIDGLRTNKITNEDVTMDLFDKCLYTGTSPEPDLIIRTSGETRLSDFMLVQSKSSFLYFCHKLWPEFTAWNLINAVFAFQYDFYTNEMWRADKSKSLTSAGEAFVNELYSKRDEYIANPQCNLQHGI